MDAEDLLLLGTAMAISAIPTGMPAFVSGAALDRRQAARRGQGRREEPHRRRDARRDERDQHRQDRHADDERDDGLHHLRPGRGSRSTVRATARPARSSRSPARPSRTSPGWRSAWCSTATRPSATTATVVGDPTEAALVVLAAKLGVERRGDPPRLPAAGGGAVRLRVQVHGDLPPRAARRHRARHRARQGRPGRGPRPLRAGRGGPLSGRRCRSSEAQAELDAANRRMGEQGLRVLAFAARLIGDEDAGDDASRTRCRSRRSSGSSAWSGSSTRCGRRPRLRSRPRSAPGSTCG